MCRRCSKESRRCRLRRSRASSTQSGAAQSSRTTEWQRSAPVLSAGWDDLVHTWNRSLADLAALRMRVPEIRRRALARRRHAVVHDRLRAGHAHLVAPDAAPRARAGSGHPAGPRGDAGDERRPRARRRARARSSTSCGAARRRSPGPTATTGPSTRRRSSSSFSRSSGAGPTIRRSHCELEDAARRALAWIDGPADRDGDGLRRVRAPQLARDRQPDLEGLRGLDGLPRRDARSCRRSLPSRCRATSTTRSCGSPRSRARSGATTLWPGSSSKTRRSCDVASTRRSGWRIGGYYALGLDREKRPIDALTSNLGHLLWSGIVPAGGARRSPTCS